MLSITHKHFVTANVFDCFLSIGRQIVREGSCFDDAMSTLLSSPEFTPALDAADQLMDVLEKRSKGAEKCEEIPTKRSRSHWEIMKLGLRTPRGGFTLLFFALTLAFFVTGMYFRFGVYEDLVARAETSASCQGRVLQHLPPIETGDGGYEHHAVLEAGIHNSTIAFYEGMAVAVVPLFEDASPGNENPDFAVNATLDLVCNACAFFPATEELRDGCARHGVTAVPFVRELPDPLPYRDAARSLFIAMVFLFTTTLLLLSLDYEEGVAKINTGLAVSISRKYTRLEEMRGQATV